MVIRAARRLSVAIATVVLAGGMLAPGVLAAGPDHEGPFAWDDTIYFPDFCGEVGRSMNVRLDTHGTESYTIWAEGEDVVKVLYRVRAPHDVFTNLDTGRQIVVRGAFQEIIERVPGTDEFTKSISGFRYLINEPGTGVVVQEVGRIVYGDLEQTIALWQAGKHDLVYNQDFVLLCDLLEQPA
jgi:hypothetical protein